MIIERATFENIPVIKKLAYDIWPVVYKEMLSDDQLQYMLQMFYSKDALAEQMKNGQQFFIAYKNETPVGFSSFTNEGEGIYKLQKLYVLKHFHKFGIGKMLMEKVKSEIIKLGGNKLILNVNRNNAAKDYYIRNGFTIIDTVDNDIGNGYFMNDYVMEKSLEKN